MGSKKELESIIALVKKELNFDEINDFYRIVGSLITNNGIKRIKDFNLILPYSKIKSLKTESNLQKDILVYSNTINYLEKKLA